MAREPPVVLPVTLPLLGHANPWALLLAKEEGYPLSTAALLSERYALKSEEKPFVRELLDRKRNLWVFRCDQRSFAGDFVVVDMSDPRPARRDVLVLDLKMGAPLVLGGGGAGVQLTQAPRAVEAVAARQGIISPGTPYALATGGKDAMITFLGSGRNRRARIISASRASAG